MIGILPQEGGLDVWSLQEEVLISWWSVSMEQSSQMCINYFASPNKWPRYGIYRHGDEVDEEEAQTAITAVHPVGPVRTG